MEPRTPTGLEHKLGEWVDAGLISADQADAILSAEKTPRSRRRVSFVAEILGYLGGTLATVAVLMLMSDVWEELTPPIQITMLLVATVVFVVAGRALGKSEEPAIERLAGFLWLASVATFSGGLYLLGSEVLDMQDERPLGLFTGLGTTVLAAPLWIVRRKALQQIALFSPLAVAAAFVPPDADGWSWALAGFGLIWFIASQMGAIEPVRTADALGVGAMAIGLQGAGFDEAGILAVATLVMGGVIVVGVTRDRNAALSVGAIGLLVFVPQLITEWFGPNLGATVAVAVTGLLIVAVAVFIGRRNKAD